MRNFEDFTVIFCRNGKTMTRNLSTAIMSNVRIETRIPTTCRNGTILHSTVPNLPCTSHSLPRSQVTVARGMYNEKVECEFSHLLAAPNYKNCHRVSKGWYGNYQTVGNNSSYTLWCRIVTEITISNKPPRCSIFKMRSTCVKDGAVKFSDSHDISIKRNHTGWITLLKTKPVEKGRKH